MKKRKICAYYGNLYRDAYRVHLDEMRHLGFNTVLLCVPEHYIIYHQQAVYDLIFETHINDMQCWVNPWRVGGIFDGEAPFGCLSGNDIIRYWINNISCGDGESQPDAIFWDNPYPFILYLIHEWTHLANERGLKNYVCISADRYGIESDKFAKIANLPYVDGIGTDPYSLGPNDSFDIETVGLWAQKLSALGAIYKKETHLWVQGFNIQEGFEDLPIRCVEKIYENGVNNIGFWSFRACEATSLIRPIHYKQVWLKFGSYLQNV